jgi:hypothetical protein
MKLVVIGTGPYISCSMDHSSSPRIAASIPPFLPRLRSNAFAIESRCELAKA